MSRGCALQLLSHPSLTSAQLRQLHAHLLTSTTHLADRFLPNNLLREASSPHRALALFPRLRRILPAFLPNNYTFSFLLTAAAAAIPAPPPHSDRRLVCSLHALAVALGWDAHLYVSNGLIHAYAARGHLASARRAFDHACSRDACSWTSLLTAHARAGQLAEARALFDGMPHRTPVAWSAMLSAHVGAGGFADALQVFDGMLRARVRPNRAAVVGALAACGALGALEQGRWVHALVAAPGRSGNGMDGVVATALVDMYAKCGSLDAAAQVFAAVPERERDVFAYTAMISGLSDHGRCGEAVELFRRMQDRGVRPNEVTFICVLSACARAGGALVGVAKEIFRTMATVYGVEPGVEHYGSMVDVLGRAGLLAEAVGLARAMPMRPDSYVLGALLNACRVHGGDMELGKELVEWLAELGLDHSGVHVQLSNMYAGSSKWEDVVRVRTAMEEKKVVKVPGCSMVEVDGVACEFVAGDRSLDPWIMAVVRELDGQLRLLGHDSRHLEELLA
ncbi:hypothetical protein QYE76_004308 [Lolium multiflorum]|uniref:Pentatricopeptide repeat-containing protein n=1 Tax=Lolium multiflorum TaxID=4521 RepID=A0AAD8RRS8_LOLMU|nr:hypothetical protein QYE76_004308 [Lolium multiflorum]